MANTFPKQVKVFNRAPITLSMMFDGERHPLPPGEQALPEHTIAKAQNQNPIMGTGDPYNPGVLGTKYLIVREDEEGFGEPLTREQWEDHCNRPCREDETIWFNEKYGDDPKAKLIKRGSKGSVHARNRSEAAVALGGLSAEFTQRDA